MKKIGISILALGLILVFCVILATFFKFSYLAISSFYSLALSFTGPWVMGGFFLAFSIWLVWMVDIDGCLDTISQKRMKNHTQTTHKKGGKAPQFWTLTLCLFL
jgi:hypothetical protein